MARRGCSCRGATLTLFAERLRRVLTDDALRDHFAGQARESVLDYGWDRIADEHLALYDQVRAARREAVSG